MPAPTSALRPISVEGYLRKDAVVNLWRKAARLVRWLRKIEKPKTPRCGRWSDGAGDAVRSGEQMTGV
jgi:hypothetical protein